MKLDEFVADTLSQIADGIRMAQVRSAESGMRINPTGLGKRVTADQLFWDAKVGLYAERVEFDLSLSVAESSSKEGKGAISVFGSNVGGSMGEQSSNSTVQRVKFGLLVVFPTAEQPVGPKRRLSASEMASGPIIE